MLKFALVGSILVILTYGSFMLANSRNDVRSAPTTNESSEATAAQSERKYRVVTQTDISYGDHRKKTYDVYVPEGVAQAPVIVMVHGGAWMVGDKSNANVVENKRDYWVPGGTVLVSVNYPMLIAGYGPDQQAAAVAEALMHIQKNAASWGSNPEKMVVMGHSAGAHLVALVTSQKARYPGLEPWAGSILLDSAALNVISVMKDPPLRSFHRVFGDDPAYWEATSPFHVLSNPTEPILIVCSSHRAAPCAEGKAYQGKASQFGTTVHIYSLDKTHEEINSELGLPNNYTKDVDAFITEALTRTD